MVVGEGILLLSFILINNNMDVAQFLSLFLMFFIVFYTCESYSVMTGVWDRNVPRQRNLIVRESSSRTKRYPATGSTINNRQSRFLSLFTFIQFSNQECQGNTGESGVCLTATDCGQKGGNANGPCAAGFGLCCTLLTTCGMTVRDNGTYFVQSGYPDDFDDTGSCQVTLMKLNSDICQYRLDFEEFNIMGPETANNMCNNDQFIVSGGSPVSPICGLNTGNHMYIDAGNGASNSIVLSVVTSGPSFTRRWKIKISQIPCNTLYQAEGGCLQYFTGVSGQITSFNYNPTDGLQLSNQDYGICVRAERNFCGIQYTQCSDAEDANNRSQSFTLSGNSNNAVQAMVGSTGGSNFCQADYLIIPMATNVGRPATGSTLNVDRICGGVLSADITLQPTTVRSSVKPFRLWFHTDNVEAPTDVANKGFCLNYVQQPCTNSLL